MKKYYITPEIEVVNVRIETHLLAGSGESSSNYQQPSIEDRDEEEVNL